MNQQKITIPKGWKKIDFGSLLVFQKGKLPKMLMDEKTPEATLPYLSIKTIDGEKPKFVSNDHEVVVFPDDLLVVADGSGSGRIYRNLEGAVSSTFFKIISSNKKIISNEFIYYIFNRLNFTRAEFRKGGAIPHFDYKNLKNLQIFIPPNLEQTKIAEILSKVDEEIEKTEGVIENTEKLKKGLMRELLSGRVRVSLSFRTKRSGERNLLNAANSKRGDDSCLRDSSLSVGMTKKTKLGEIPEEWQVVKIKNSGIKLIDGDRGVNYPQNKDFFSNEYCLFLNNKNVKNNRFVFDDCKFITKEKDEELRKGKLEREDVILTTRGTVGNVAYYSSIIPYENIRINSGMLIFRHGKNYNPLFLYKLLSSPFMKQKYKDMSSGSAQPQLPVGSLEQIEIPLLSIDEQKKSQKFYLLSMIKFKLINKLKINLLN